MRYDDTTPATVTRLLAAVPAAYRSKARALITDPRQGGRGLRAWLAILDTEGRPLPDELPEELVSVYLSDDDAEPLFDCEHRGMPVPVRAARRCGHEAAVDRVYFTTCPCCGGRTGRHAYWSRQAETA